MLKRPALSLVLSVAVLLALAAPIFGMHIGTSGVTTLPERFESRQGFAVLAREFPEATTEPTEIVVTEQASQPAVRQALVSLRSTLADDARFGAGAIERSADGETAVLTVPVRGDPSGEVAIEGVRDLRSPIVPAAFRDTDAEVLVGGVTSENIDYFDSVIDPAPYVIAFVLGLTFVLLTIVFRSVAIAGLWVSPQPAFCRRGVRAARARLSTRRRRKPLRLPGGGVDRGLGPALPLLGAVRAVDGLPGLHAQPDQGAGCEEGGDTADAVYFGVASTARIITGAALIIVAVFAGFARGDLIMLQQMGFGVAVALLIDATVIRSVVLPSAMKILGRWNWYVPELARVASARTARGAQPDMS